MPEAGGNEVQLTKLLRGLVTHFGDTYYGGLAKQEADAASPPKGDASKEKDKQPASASAKLGGGPTAQNQ